MESNKNLVFDITWSIGALFSMKDVLKAFAHRNNDHHYRQRCWLSHVV